MAFWALLVLTLEAKYKQPGLLTRPKNEAEVYACGIKKVDKYLGYIAWTELYSYSGLKTDNEAAKDILWELVAKDANRPEAYCKLWAIYNREHKLDTCVDICDRLFLEASEYDDNEYM
jgi:hypothetical protein